MRIRHYLYNAFLIETPGKKIAIDPGALFAYYFRFTPLIPKAEWPDLTHIFVTHGDPDHYWHVDRAARASGAPVVCNRTMLRSVDGKALMLGPRSKGVSFTTVMERVMPLDVDAEIEVDGVTVRGLKATHGPLLLQIGPFSTEVRPGPNERIGWGSIGFSLDVDGKILVNLGDTLLHADAWSNIRSPDVLMLPIGGRIARNTMDEADALEAVAMMRPRLVIPCHYDCPGFFTRRLNPADVAMFAKECRKLGVRCEVMGKADTLDIQS